MKLSRKKEHRVAYNETCIQNIGYSDERARARVLEQTKSNGNNRNEKHKTTTTTITTSVHKKWDLEVQFQSAIGFISKIFDIPMIDATL